MIKPYNGARAEKIAAKSEPLPAGGYVVKILKGETGKYSNGNEYLDIFYDVAEGEYAGFFKKQYDANTNEDKKWKGRYRLNIPDENSKWFDSQQRSFNGFIFDVEDSNTPFTWNWDEKALKGKVVGVLYRDKEWEFNGRTGWTTECAFTTTAEDIRKGNFKTPRAKALPESVKTAIAAPQIDESEEEDGDLPF